MSLLSRIFGGSGKKKMTINDLQILVPNHYTPEEAKEVFTSTLIQMLREEGVVLAMPDEKKDRDFARSVGIQDMQYEWMRDHWFGKWLKFQKEQQT